MTGIWARKNKNDISKSSMFEVTRNMEAVCQLAITLGEVWLEGDLLIDYTDKSFWGDDVNPKVEQGLIKLGFERRK